MNVVIQGSNNYSVSDRMKDYIQKRVGKLDYFKNHINDINFHLESEKLQYKIDAILSIRKFGTHKFNARADEMYTAIDKIIHKMDVKINREKSKIQDHGGLNHEQTIEFFYEHESNKPEPTRNIAVKDKPTTLSDAYLEMNEDHIGFFGFKMIDDDESISIAFLRKLEDDIIYLFKQKDDNTYSEYSIKADGSSVATDKFVRDIELTTHDLLDEQKKILDQDYHFDVFINSSTGSVNFLFKEGNGKWILIG
jgi:ribosomal subunit interface protein